jgi:hypothetical protein
MMPGSPNHYNLLIREWDSAKTAVAKEASQRCTRGLG